MKNHFLILAVLFALGSTSLHAQLPSYLPTDGLVGYWPFNGNANDESGNGNHGVVNGAVLAEDRNSNANSAYSFNGSNSYIDIGSTNGLSSNLGLTMSVWLNWSGPNSWSHQYLYIIAPNPNGAITLGNDGTLAVNVLNCNCLSDVGVSTVINQNIWYHVGLTYDLATGTLKLYLDGELIQSNSESIFSYYSTNNPGDRFGNYHFNEYYFSGKLDEGTLYNRALTQEEITALYNGTTAGGGGGNGGTAGTPAPSVPQGIPYQAMIRDNNGLALLNIPVTVRFSLRQDAIDGTVEYQETHNLTTNAFGLINTQFGSGTATQGTFANINWSNTTKFIQVEANTGAGYVDMGTQQMMSVPFAIKANESNKVKNAGLPVYPDNAAALAGGLVAGEMYRTATGDLKIVY